MLCICTICISAHACKAEGTFWNNHSLHLQTPLTLFTKVAIRPGQTVCLKRCFMPLHDFKLKLGKKAKSIQFCPDCYE